MFLLPPGIAREYLHDDHAAAVASGRQGGDGLGDVHVRLRYRHLRPRRRHSILQGRQGESNRAEDDLGRKPGTVAVFQERRKTIDKGKRKSTPASC